MKSAVFVRIALLSTLMLFAVSASAATAVTVTKVNLRAGPALQYPVVVAMPASVQLVSFGCTADMQWCDVSWNGQRGWVASPYIRWIYQQAPMVVSVSSAPVIGIGVVAFDYGYWQRYYVGRPWYGAWGRYARYAPPLPPHGHLGGHPAGNAPPPSHHHGAPGCSGHGCDHGGSPR